MYSADGKNKNHSGVGHFASNIILFVVLFAILCAAIYALSFADLHEPWAAWFPFFACVLGGAVAFGVGKHLSGRSDPDPEKSANEHAVDQEVDREYREAVTKN